MSKRTDCHCPSNFVLADYDFQLAFSVAFDFDGDPIDESGLERLISIASEGDSFVDTHGKNVKRLLSVYNGASTLYLRCDVCGASFKHGSLLSHKSGKLLVVGHECSDTIQGAAAGAKKIKGLVLEAAKKSKRSKARARAKVLAQKLIDAHEGLSEALEVDHYIVKDIKARLTTWGTLSEAQIDLVFKIQKQIEEREVAPEAMVGATVEEGKRSRVTAKIVHTKTQETYFGYNRYNSTTVLKGLFIIETPEGNWKTWGTVSDNMRLDEFGVFDINKELRGTVVSFDAKFSISKDDPTMTFFSRPTKVEVQ